jgi:hypothetical protein
MTDPPVLGVRGLITSFLHSLECTGRVQGTEGVSSAMFPGVAGGRDLNFRTSNGSTKCVSAPPLMRCVAGATEVACDKTLRFR